MVPNRANPIQLNSALGPNASAKPDAASGRGGTVRTRMDWFGSGIAAFLFAAVVGFFCLATDARAENREIGFGQLLGWATDDHQAALDAFLVSCKDINAVDWRALCRMAETHPDARTFFETFFTPVVVRDEKTALFTGYFEPVLSGSRQRTEQFRYPIYRRPKGLRAADPNLTRAGIDRGALAGKGLEIAYVDDPVAAYYLHIQGSGRIVLPDGQSIRVGYAGENGHVYRSAAAELVRRGEINFASASIEGIKAWFARNPVRGRVALQHNASFVFFRELEQLPSDSGPHGALDLPLTTKRSIAVDPKFTQMGAPVWIEKGGRDALRRLMVAQDVGSVIKGPQRADIFFGTGDAAGRLAGQTRDGGRMVVLVPIPVARRLLPGG